MAAGFAAVNPSPRSTRPKLAPILARVLGAIAILLVLIAAAALAFPPHRDLVTTIDIAAPPDRVWAVLTDTAAYPAWNPDMVLKGALVPGQVIEHDEGQGSGRLVFHPTVMAATPARELSWLGHIGPPRIFDALHYFRLQPAAGPAGSVHTLFTQGEHIRGVLLYVFDADQLLPGFKAMNARLKARAEQSFPTAPVPTTSRP